jgi:fatty acid desaturase
MNTAVAIPNRMESLSLARNRHAWPNITLVTAIFLLYSGGLALLMSNYSWLSIAAAIAMLSQSMIWSWYLSHDCAHRLVSKRDSVSLTLGEFLGLINGMAYTPFSAYRLDHLRHHVDKVDLLGTDLRAIVRTWPRSVTWLFSGLEMLYIPVFFYVIKWRLICDVLALGTARERLRVGMCLALYSALFYQLLNASVAALAALFIAVFARIHLTRFVDAFQHTYDQIDPDSPYELARSRAYECRNTFSLPVARKRTWLNVLILNFGFHYAHHLVPSCPWYALPKLDRLVANEVNFGVHRYPRETEINFFDLVSTYHAHRVRRIFDTQEGDAYDDAGHFSLRDVGFLTHKRVMPMTTLDTSACATSPVPTPTNSSDNSCTYFQ